MTAALPRVLVLRARFNDTVTSALLEGALRALQGKAAISGGAAVEVAGAWELLGAAARAVRGTEPPDGVLVLGAIIQGETSHHLHLADAVFGGLARLQADTGVPLGLGVITAPTVSMAQARAGGPKGNKGAEAALALLGALAVD